MSLFPIGALVGADTSAFIGSMGGATRGLTAFTGAAGLAAGAIGAFAGAAVLGAAVQAAKEYQIELVKLNTLVGIQTEQIEEWDGAMKELAISTGKAPADIARAMFAIASGGARGTEAMELLEQSAKASAIGLGDMTAIGRTATAMLQAFGDEGLTAEKAIDVLVATVREGNLEASSLAGAFSRVLGPAKKLGSSVEEIGAFMATFTRLGGSTEEAATGLLNVFNLLIKPPKDAREAMEEYGLSIESVRKQITEEGLPAALNRMNEVLGDNVDALGEVIPNTRALIGFLNTAGLQGEEFARIFMDIDESLGLTNEGFDTWGDTADATFSRFTSSLKVAGIAIGEALLPPLEALLRLITPLIAALGSLVDVIDDLVRFLGADLGEDLERLIFWFMGVKEAVEPTTEALAAMKEAWAELTPAELIDRQRELREEVAHMNEVISNGGRGARAAVRVRAELIEELLILGPLIMMQATAEEEVADATERSIGLTQEQLDLEKDRQDSVIAIIDALEEELLMVNEGERAVLQKRLTDLKALGVTTDYILELFDLIAAREADIAATEEHDRAQERATAAEVRRRRTLARERERAEQALERATARSKAAEEFARINNQMREAQQIAQETAGIIGDSFNDIIDGTESVADAFKNMVTEILRQVQRLLIQRTIVEPIIRALTGAFGPSSGLSASEVSAGLAIPELANIPDNPSFNPFIPRAVAGRSLTPTTVVQQNITFAPSFLDGADGARWLRGQSQEIMTIVGEGAQRSVGFSRVLRGGVG